MVCGVRWIVVAVMVLGWGSGLGQVLARRNWEGSGVRVQAWWARGVFCSAGGDLKRVVGEMDRLERMGCDAVEVDPGAGYGAVALMDGVMEEAGRRRMRVVVDLDGSAGELGLRERVGFWGARGVAGFAARGGAAGVVGRLRQSAPGRLWIGEGGQLRVMEVPEGDAASVRAGLAGRLGAGVLLEDGREGLTYARAAVLLLSGVAVRVRVDAVMGSASLPGEGAREFSAEEMLLWVPRRVGATDGMEDWVRRLGDVRRESAALRVGSAVFLDFDALGVVGWVVAGRAGSVLVVCDLSGKAVRVPVRGAGVRGSLVKTLLRSEVAVGGEASFEGVAVGVDGVFVGEGR